MEIETKKISTRSIIIIAIAATIGSIVGGYIIDGIKGKRSSFDSILVEAANELNKNLPIMMDSETRLDSTMALPGKEYVYFISLINYAVDEIDIEDFEKEIKQNLINNARTNSSMEIFRNNNVTLIYVYRDKNMNEIVTVKVSSKDYR
jgi:hypothetical protein